MLRYFFEKSEPSQTDYLRAWVSQNSEVMQHQGQYPVIYLTFKDVKEDTWEKCFNKMAILLTQEIQRHQSLLSSISLNEQEQQNWESC